MTEKTPAGGTGELTGGAGQEQVAGSDEQVIQYDGWISDQPEPVKSMLEGHQRGLKSALESERETRKNLERQLRDLAAKAEKGSELQSQLTELVNQQSQAEARASFYEDAHTAGVTNLKLAWLVVGSDGLMDGRGRVDFAALKQRYPELFGAATRTAPGNAGAGTNQPITGKQSMNDYIRQAAGRRP